MKRIIAVGMTAMAAVCAEAKVATGVLFSSESGLPPGPFAIDARTVETERKENADAVSPSFTSPVASQSS